MKRLDVQLLLVLVPELTPGNVFIMDNLSSRKRASVRDRTYRRDTAFPLTLQSRLQSYREGVLAAQSHLRKDGNEPILLKKSAVEPIGARCG